MGMFKVLAITFCLSMLSLESVSQLRVGPNKRFLISVDGKPFFWLGDTAWELFHRLTREEAENISKIVRTKASL